MSAAVPAPDAPVVSVAGAIARMEAIGAALPAADGLACFNRMYLDVTRQVDSQLGQGFFADPAFMTQLDVTFANLYFAAADAASTQAAVPLAWRPLMARRAVAGIEPVQFALAGMNAHINHDLPLAVVSTCTALGTAPDASPHFADYQKIDQLLDAAEQSVRQSFESAAELAADRHLASVATLIANWTVNSGRDLAWNNCLLLWAVRDDRIARGLFLDTLATSTALASQILLVAV
jgi:ketosteroid isomerase-like protein